MKGVRNIYHHSYKFSFLLVFFVLLLLHPVLSIYVSTLSSTESLTVSSNRTIVSKGGDFELGFFKPSARSRWYLGIWYKKVPERTYAWVANRDNPLSKPIGTLKIYGNNLVLLDHSDKLVWSTNLTRGIVRSPMVAELLSNGNFVMRYFNNNDPSGFLWQSFDFPTDTLLPEMKLGWDRKKGLNRFLTSWRSLDDPSSGNYLYKLLRLGTPEFFLFDEDVQLQRSGPWNGIQFNGIPEVRELDYMIYNFTDNKDEIAYTFLMTNQTIHSRLTVSLSGYLNRHTWIPPSYGWRQFWSVPTDNCDMYGGCGPYGYCDVNTSPICNCIRGFDPRYLQDWMLRRGSGGCVRRTQLSCGGDGFTRLRKMKLPDTTSVIVDRSISTEGCKKRCLKNCNCTAFASADIKGGWGCIIWTEELFDLRKYATAGQDLYVRLAAADIEKEREISGIIIGLIVGIIIILLLSFTLFSVWKRKQKHTREIAGHIVYQERSQDLTMNEVVISSSRHLHNDNLTEDVELPLLEFKVVVMATENFSECNMLGKGGFGVVYKGKLSDGKEIAVKRLSQMSLQGNKEFKNELKLIAKLQHINLVRLLGCCIDGDEKMLIYEYLENLGLDSYLFDKTRSYKLDWQKRFEIVNGIARGLLYLHQDSRFRIIHRDLKASNVLLDKDMTPKISDFGMARIFGRDETEANTRKVVGTYGYMSPEYAMEGIFSMKSDVYSFGVLLLEIISGRRNRRFYTSDLDINLLGCVWRNWKEGNGLELVDPIIKDSSSASSTFRPHEALRCTQVGLLCVQEHAHDRPYMSSVVLMLGSETETIPQPNPPGYHVETNYFEANWSSGKQCEDESWTENEITVSVVDAR